MNNKDIKASENLKRIWLEYKADNKGVTQKDVAIDLGFSQPNFNSYMQGNQKIGLEALIKLSAYFGVKCSDIREDLEV